jgi:hypothetical protein
MSASCEECVNGEGNSKANRAIPGILRLFPHQPGRAGPGIFMKRRLSSWIVLALAATPVPVRAAPGRVEITGVGVREERLVAVVSLVDAFDAETRRAVERGLPITVRFTTELWRDRSRWFDKQIDSKVTNSRLRWVPGQRHFEILDTGAGRYRETFPGLDAALERLTPREVDVHDARDLQPDAPYYLAVEAALRPLTLEEFRQLDGWIDGRIRGEDGEPDVVTEGGGEGGVSGAVFGFFVNLAGFGDTILRARGEIFRPRELGELPAGPDASVVSPDPDSP